ncbi:hypothetical protein [Paenibacillus naphthalenovorans]|uniref:Phage capsid family protein n=1 Tax=Paenibacillus naphthalenovorans TaxID=162209 RepID=A0A0U2MWK7_9BACL|nr:hypothetical protein [Paenibacillus naphthalenovorans]ALS22303.1 hypothetical protein IJ22_19290 [Paenibacillus naphthalenovorans]
MSKLFTTEIASAIKETNIIELSERAKTNTLDASDKEMIEVLDTFAKEIGTSGKSYDNNFVISELIKRTVEPLVFQPETSILSSIFNMGSIGEFDEAMYTGLPKNTIKVYDAVRGGNVPKSYVDPGVFQPVKTSLQVETELNYSDLRRNGWKSIAKMTELTREAFEQEMFYRLFAGVDGALDALTGEQDIDSGSALTQANAETLARYLRDMSEGNPFMVGLSKYIDGFARLNGYESYLSDDLKNELNRVGRLAMFDGVKLSSIPTAKKTAKGNTLVPDKRIFGIAGIIGDAQIRGEMRLYETYDNNAEKVELKFTGYDFDYVIYYLDKIARITFS